MFGGGGDGDGTHRAKGDFPGLFWLSQEAVWERKRLEELEAGRRPPQPDLARGPRSRERWLPAAGGASACGVGGTGVPGSPRCLAAVYRALAAFRRCPPQPVTRCRLQRELPSARKQELEKVAWHVGADPDQRDGKAALFVCGVYRGSLKKGPEIHFRAELLFVSCFLLRGSKRVWYERSLDREGGNVAFAQWRVRDKCFADDCTSNVSGSSHPRIPSHHYAKRMISH